MSSRGVLLYDSAGNVLVGQGLMAGSVPVALASDHSNLPVQASSSAEKAFTVIAESVALANNKSLLSVFNPVGSGIRIRLREFYVRNPQTANVMGVVADFRLFRWAHTVAPTGGSTIVARAHDTADTLNVGVDLRTGGTLGGTEEAQSLDLMRISTDEWGPGALDQEGFQQGFANYFPARSMASSVIKPFTARPGEGLHMKMATNTAVSTVDVIFVFTEAA